MKKRKIIMSIALASVLAVSPATLIACSGDHYSAIKFDAQDTRYVVTSQGGAAVSYGNYVYFINGTRGYDDTEGTANIWKDTVKGALYRAELNGKAYFVNGKGERDYNIGSVGDNYIQFEPTADSNGIEFVYTEEEDYFGDPVNVVGVDEIASKTIGTSGYEKGGIFIYDNAVYFASPNNERSKSGTVQTGKTDFFMMPLSGGKPTKLYTSRVDTASSAYAFYKNGDSVYLVVNEGSDIVSVKINPDKARAEKPQIFEVNATSVYFPVRDTYYKGISTNTPEDFIYFVRPVGDDDSQRAGTVIEAMRPDGSENFVVSMTGATETIEAVRNGILFYRTSRSSTSNSVMAYTNLHEEFMAYSDTYKAEQDALAADKKNSAVRGEFAEGMLASATNTYAFRADEKSNTVYCMVINSTSMHLYQNSVEKPIVGTISTDILGTPQFIQNNYLYLSTTSNIYYRASLFANMEGYGSVEQIVSDTITGGISCDYAAGYFMYFGKVDQWATAYTFFTKVDGIQGLEPQFVGQRADFDIPTEEQIENVTGNSSN